jgi:hypothetical protein
MATAGLDREPFPSRLQAEPGDRLRTCLFLWAEQSRRRCAWAQAYYRAHRQRGQNHATALRCLGQRWLKILWRMWQDRTPYDEALHIRNQVRHGSWVLELTTDIPA